MTTVECMALEAQNDDNFRLSLELQRSEELRGQLQEQLRRLMGNAYIAGGQARREASRLATELEEMVRQKDVEHEQVTADQVRLESARVQADADQRQLALKVQELESQRERLRLEVDIQNGEVARVQEDMRVLRERLPIECQEALETALASVVSGQPLGNLALPSSSPMPSVSTETVEKVVDRLRQEKQAMYDRIQALQADILQSASTVAALKEEHAKEIKETKSKADGLAAEREKLHRSALKTLKNIKMLQQKVVKQDLLLQRSDFRSGLATHFESGGPREDFDDEASDAGLSQMSELDGLENALDVFIAEGQLHHQLAKKLEASAALPPDTIGPDFIRTIVCVELVGFDAGYSSVTTGLRPQYSSQVSFGPFIVSDSILRLFLEGSLRVELRGSLPTDSTHHILAKGTIPLARAIEPRSDDQRHCPPTATTLTLFDPTDGEVAAAKLRIKFRLRYPMADLMEDYRRRQGVEIMSLKRGPTGLTVATLGAVSGRRMLAICVKRVFGLRSARAQYTVAPYVFYQLPRQPPYFTRIGRGNDCVLDDLSVVSVQVDTEFCQWASKNGLHFIVFDDGDIGAAAAQAGSKESSVGFMGEVQVPFSDLLRDSKAKIDGIFALKKSVTDPAHAAVGYIQVTMWWEDTKLASSLDALPHMATPIEREYRSVSARLARGLATEKEVSDLTSALNKVAVPLPGRSHSFSRGGCRAHERRGEVCH
mmetsp:Transcript_84205/g.176230  ORF Transcript_84205/g.176230 Transcript_84205/m.176230 type:complete len:715 (-) Transcript_84205:576-2720(-)